MLSNADYNQLILFYDRFERMNSHIKELILLEQYDDVDSAIQEKEVLLRNIVSFEKPRLDDIKSDEKLNSIRLRLIELEKDNIELVKQSKNELIKQLSEVKKTKKVINAYEPSLQNVNSTIDIKEEI